MRVDSARISPYPLLVSRRPVGTTTWTALPSFPGASSLTVVGGAVAQVNTSFAYVFGGTLASGAMTNAVVAVTPTGLSSVITAGGPPSARSGAVAVHLAACYTGPPVMTGSTGACLLVFGGYSAGSPFMGDLWVLDLRVVPPVWSSPSTAGSAPPAARYGASAAASGDGTYALFFGGTTAAGAMNDLYAFAPGSFTDADKSEMMNLARPLGVQMNTTMSSTDPVWAGNSDRANDGFYTTNVSPMQCRGGVAARSI